MPAALLLIDRPIVLVGPMGAGKTTVGRALAERLRVPFFDADEEIERQAGRSIDNLFVEDGEPAFRGRERMVTGRLIAGGGRVVATGAGAFMDEETCAAVLSRCITVWLNAAPETLAARVEDDRGRPLLRDREPLEALRELAEVRDPVYARAPVRIDADAGSVAEVVESVVRSLEKLDAAP